MIPCSIRAFAQRAEQMLRLPPPHHYPHDRYTAVLWETLHTVRWSVLWEDILTFRGGRPTALENYDFCKHDKTPREKISYYPTHLYLCIKGAFGPVCCVYWPSVSFSVHAHTNTLSVSLKRNADLLHEQRWLCNGLTTAGATHWQWRVVRSEEGEADSQGYF